MNGAAKFLFLTDFTHKINITYIKVNAIFHYYLQGFYLI